MNNKGFISISVIYSFFLVFLMLLLFIVNGYVNNRILIKKISDRITKDVISTTFCEAHYREKACDLYSDYDPDNNNYGLIYHNSSITNGANDNSYRYSGENPNNYVCFGSTAQSCPSTNLYRIIGIIPVKIVTDNTSIPIKTEEKVLYKLIKSSLYKLSTIGSDKIYIDDTTNMYESNTWSTSSLLNTDLNGTYLETTLGKTWSDMIANAIWKVGGNTNLTSINITQVYAKEILESSYNNTSDGNNEISKQVGLLYLSDYGFASPSRSWNTNLSNENIKDGNWLSPLGDIWTMTRDSNNRINLYIINSSGSVSSEKINDMSLGVSPVFYLNDDVKIVTSGHNGSSSDPYRISLGGLK